MAEYTGSATNNSAVVIGNNEGHKVPDTFAYGECNDANHPEEDAKFGTPHAKMIHNDIHRRFGSDSEVDDPK